MTRSSADPYWRTRHKRLIKGRQLTEKLKTAGFTLKRSLVHLQLVPRRKDETEEQCQR